HDTTSTSFSRCSVYCLPDRTDGRLIVTLRRRPARSTLFPYTTLFRSVPRRLTADGLRQVIAFITRMTAADRAELGGVSAERSTQVVAGALVADAAMRARRLDEVRISPWALRDAWVQLRLATDMRAVLLVG